MTSKIFQKEYDATVDKLRDAEAQLGRTRARLEQILGGYTTAQLELAAVDRESDALVASDDDFVTATRMARDIADRRATAEKYAGMVDLMATAERRKVATAVLEIHRIEADVRAAAQRYYDARFRELATEFVDRHKNELQTLVQSAFLDSVCSSSGHEYESAQMFAPQTLRAVWEHTLCNAVVERAGGSCDANTEVPTLGKGTPSAIAVRASTVTAYERSKMSEIELSREPERLLAALVEGPPPPDPLEGYSRNPQQIYGELRRWTLLASQKAELVEQRKEALRQIHPNDDRGRAAAEAALRDVEEQHAQAVGIRDRWTDNERLYLATVREAA